MQVMIKKPENMKRVTLRKGLPSLISLKGASQLLVIAGVAFEFGEYVNCVSFQPEVAIRNCDDMIWQQVKVIGVKKTDMYYAIKCSLEECVVAGGKYQLKIGGITDVGINTPGTDSHMSAMCSYGSDIIPFLSDYFEIMDDDRALSTMSLPMLTNYREVVVPICGRVGVETVSPVKVLIKEDYGATIGSHIWDSSLILCEYMHKSGIGLGYSSLATDDDGCVSVCLELGAGVGVVGLYVAKAARRRSLVVLTDIQRQMAYLNTNIALNSHPGLTQARCVSMVLDWNSIPDDLNGAAGNTPCSYRDEIVTLHRETVDPSARSSVCQSSYPVIDLIVAADVLYDQTATDGLFRTLRCFATAGRTDILIAQKIRGADTLVDISAVPGFISELVHEECNVLVFKLSLL